jgi:hypothetical protein
MGAVAGANLTQTLIGLRLAIGLGSWLMPRVSGRLFGLDASANPQLPYLGRLFGARDVALAAGLVMTDGGAHSQWLQIGVACDVADVAAGVAAGTRGYLGPVSAALVTATAAGAAALGVAALQAGSDGSAGAPGT